MTATSDIVEQINLASAIICLHDDGMISYHFNEGYLVDVPDIIEMSAAREKLAGNKPRPVLIITSRYLNITPEGRAYNINDHRSKHTLAEAYVITNLATRIATNFYHFFNPPSVPVKIFKKEHDAVDWLRNFLQL
jgi:hypothetical protein